MIRSLFRLLHTFDSYEYEANDSYYESLQLNVIERKKKEADLRALGEMPDFTYSLFAKVIIVFYSY